MSWTPVKTLSATMVACIDFAQEHGGLIRMAGGFWTKRGAGWNGMRPNAEYFGASTVQACVDRGELEYTEYKHGRNDTFPIAASVKVKP